MSIEPEITDEYEYNDFEDDFEDNFDDAELYCQTKTVCK